MPKEKIKIGLHSIKLIRTQQHRTKHNKKLYILYQGSSTLKTLLNNLRKREVKNMAKKVETKTIELQQINPKRIIVSIEGDSDLVLNKMNDVSTRQLTDQRKNKAKSIEKPNEWEQIITSIHWLNGKPNEFSEESLKDALENNAPCLTAFGLKKSFGQAVTRTEIAQYATKFDASVNIIGKRDRLVPIKFAEHHIDEKLMSPKKGAPVFVRLNRFSGWSAEIEISYIDNVYSEDQIVNIVNLAGFGIGIGSGRSSGYGRYHVTDVRMA